MTKIKNIAVLTSGGDAPGMNAGIRAVVRSGIFHGLNVFGVRRGYSGLVNGDILPMDAKSVANIIQRGGTILKTARSEEFKTKEGRQQAYDNIKKHKIDGLVVIGGDGTFTGASVFPVSLISPLLVFRARLTMTWLGRTSRLAMIPLSTQWWTRSTRYETRPNHTIGFLLSK